MKVLIEVCGYLHDPDCLVARFRNQSQWESSGFPWCTCYRLAGLPKKVPRVRDQAYWYGKNLAAIQMLVAAVPREYGYPVARVDCDWNLTVMTAKGLTPVPYGSRVVVDGERVMVLP